MNRWQTEVEGVEDSRHDHSFPRGSNTQPGEEPDRGSRQTWSEGDIRASADFAPDADPNAIPSELRRFLSTLRVDREKVFSYGTEVVRREGERGERIKRCGSKLTVLISPSLRNDFRLTCINSCNCRFCPRCRPRNSKKKKARIERLMSDILAEHGPLQGLFLTLLGPEAGYSDLRVMVEKLKKNIAALYEHKDVPALGCLWFIEVTRFDEDRLRPHAHMVLLLSRSYRNGRKYLSIARWGEIYEEVSGQDDPNAIVVKSLDPSSLGLAVSDLVGYSTKALGEEWSDSEMAALREATHGLVLSGSRGIFRQSRKTKPGSSGCPNNKIDRKKKRPIATIGTGRGRGPRSVETTVAGAERLSEERYG
ncbi:MAG: protein rep [Thermoanaerobaculia bacterium]|nr:protein rep [Thermoanaerobaculia bacterium]